MGILISTKEAVNESSVEPRLRYVAAPNEFALACRPVFAKGRCMIAVNTTDSCLTCRWGVDASQLNATHQCDRGASPETESVGLDVSIAIALPPMVLVIGDSEISWGETRQPETALALAKEEKRERDEMNEWSNQRANSRGKGGREKCLTGMGKDSKGAVQRAAQTWGPTE
jgi:hypothetical protein